MGDAAPRRELPSASLVEGLRFTLQVMMPNLVQGLFRQLALGARGGEEQHVAVAQLETVANLGPSRPTQAHEVARRRRSGPRGRSRVRG